MTVAVPKPHALMYAFMALTASPSLALSSSVALGLVSSSSSTCKNPNQYLYTLNNDPFLPLRSSMQFQMGGLD